jgi:hypothetical protein
MTDESFLTGTLADLTLILRFPYYHTQTTAHQASKQSGRETGYTMAATTLGFLPQSFPESIVDFHTSNFNSCRF